MPSKSAGYSLIEKERAVRLLRSSKLIIYDEYKSMLRMIEQHHNEIKQSLAQKKKRDHDMRPFLYDTGDTYEKPFFSVLIKMLTEINSTKNSSKQIEDLQRVYQWYLTNKKQLCKTQPMFGDADQDIRKERLLNPRPSSSIDPGNRIGILRHDKSAIEVDRNTRPQTSYPTSRTGLSEANQDNNSVYIDDDDRMFNVKSIDGIDAPKLPDNLTDQRTISIMKSPKLLRRPDTAPSMVKLDPNLSNESPESAAKFSAKELKNQENGPVPLSKVSVHFDDNSKAKRALHIHLPKGEDHNGSEAGENEARTRLHNRSQSADLEKSARFKNNANVSDGQSELDEDRVLLDPEQFFVEADMNDKSVEGLTNRDLQKTYNSPSGSKNGDNSSLIEEKTDIAVDGNGKLHSEERPENFDSTKAEYISSYSKFQRVQNQKNTSIQNHEHTHQGKDAAKSVYQSLLDNSRSLGNLQRNKGTRNGVATSAVLELVTPIGQQMFEQKSPHHVTQEFRKDFENMSGGSPNSSPRDRPSPRLFLRGPTGMKSDHSNNPLRKAEISLKPEENSRQYKVHFPKETTNTTVKHYRVSGPVEPNSQRYQYTDDGFGHKTYVKRLARSQHLHDSNAKSNKSKKRTQSSETILNGTRTPYMNTKSLTSLMIVRHLGGAERRSSDRMTGKSNAVPIWISAQDSSSSIYDEREYVKLTRPYEQDLGVSSESPNEQRSDYHVQQLDVDLPSILHVSKDKDFYIKDKDLYIKNYGKQSKNPNVNKNYIDSSDGVPQESLSATFIEQYNGGFYPLRAQGFALPLRVENQMPQNPDTPSDAYLEAARESLSRHQTQRPVSAVSKPKRPISGYSKASSRASSAQSSRRTRAAFSNKEFTDDGNKPVFNVKDFSHFCLDDNMALQEDFQYQRKVNAAVNIQRIFRGYMTRKYMNHLKISENERQRKAAVTLQSAMRGYFTRKQMMKQNLRKRSPAFDTVEWAKTYKDELKKRDNARLMKANTRSKKILKARAEHEEKLKRVNATTTIYEIFHDKGPSKAQMKAAAITIQRYVRGWLVRKNFKKAKYKAMKRTLDFSGFLNSYRLHLEKIMEQHGVKDQRATISFDEVLEYIEKRNKYDIEYERIAKGQNGVFTYEDIKKFFEACGHHPSRAEVDEAIKLALKDVTELKQHTYTKKEMAEIAFSIYVPKGTKLTDTRKSTWLNPLVDGDEAARIKLTKKINEETNLNKVLAVMSESKKGLIEADLQVTSQPIGSEKIKVQQPKNLSKLKKR